jgi:hypothetical protein
MCEKAATFARFEKYRFGTSFLALWSCLLWNALGSVSLAEPPELTRFFEMSVRPLLEKHCLKCHGKEKQESSLRLDRRSSALRGGVSGPAIVPGRPGESLILKVLSGEGDVQMPPDQPLPAEQVDVIRQWIRAGAPWPQGSAGEPEDPASHWAFQPLRSIATPITNSDWVRTPIDQFILTRLELEGLSPSRPASKLTLLRRVSLDLLGLPPTIEEMATFLADDRPAAYERLVDRLLASPRYGERWGRYWLDVARYADNKGHVFFEEKNFPWAWAYRDYVVRAFNEDLPYDRFVLEQIAADQMDLNTDRRPLAAMGFLTIGARFSNNAHDVIDDRIDVVTRGLMGLTVTCARCHDHKFDPIPQADYYSLYGVFRSSSEPTLGPLFEDEPRTTEYVEFSKGLAERVQKLEGFVEKQRQEMMESARYRTSEYLLAVHGKRNHPSTENFMLLTEKGKLSPAMIHRWEVYLQRVSRDQDPIWSVWYQFSEIPDDEFSARASDVRDALLAAGTKSLHPFIRQKFKDAVVPRSMGDVADLYGAVFSEVERRWGQLQAKAQSAGQNPPAKLDDAGYESLRSVLYGPTSPVVVPRTLGWGFLDLLPDRPTQAEYKKLIKEVEQFSTKQAAAPPRAMVLLDVDPLYRPAVFLRGNPNREGRSVPRQFLEVLTTEKRRPFRSGSGRLELAQQIVSRDNPMTARVMVNRIWRHHFGRGIVETPSNFGIQGELPSHLELLDWLSIRFMESGWSVKQLHRLMLRSATYRQSSLPSTEFRERVADRDPENKLLSHFRRHRLDFEAMRDSMLSVSGLLDHTIGGPPTDLFETMPPRRSVYGFIDRMDLPNLLRSFDFPDPASSSPKREETTVPPQSLFFMNHPFVIRCADSLSAHPEFHHVDDPGERAVVAFSLVLGRPPSADEEAMARRYVLHETADAEESAWQYGFGRVDEQAQRVRSFTALTHWTGSRWQAGARLPDAKLGWVFIDRQGGHPAATNDRCAIRRWVSPIDGTVSFHGTLQHVPAEGNGVRGRLISSRHGILGQWKVHHSEHSTRVGPIEVQVGDTIDLVVDFQDHITHDEHLWPVVISGEGTGTWDSQQDFKGAETDRWQTYLQALLMTNEFVFID